MWRTLAFFVFCCSLRHISTEKSNSSIHIRAANILIGPKQANSSFVDLATYFLSQNKTLIESKVEPEFEFGNVEALLSCNLSLDRNQKIGDLTVFWLKGGKPISKIFDSDRFTGAETNTMIIYRTKRSDADLYTARFKQSVNGKLLAHNCNVNYFAKPLVLDFEKSKNILEGYNLELECNIKSHPKAHVTWFKNGKDVRSFFNHSTRLELKSFGDYIDAYLTITHLRKDDGGTYSCEAYSPYFKVSNSKSIVVRITDRLAVMWPLLGIVVCLILVYLSIIVFESDHNKRIRREEMQLYRQSKRAPKSQLPAIVEDDDNQFRTDFASEAMK